MAEFVSVATQARVAVVTLSRPARRNALNLQVKRELVDALEGALADAEVAAIVLGHFGGQEFGAALADVLLGAAEPGGRLTTTWPGVLADAPVTEVIPTDGTLRYTEGLHIGYRAWLKAERVPAFAFGHGLGYTTWELSGPSAAPTADGGARVRVQVANTGDRAGKHVVQVYASKPGSAIDRPVRWLAGFGSVRAGAGESAELEIDVPARAFEHWDVESGGWQREAGSFTLQIGSSVTELPLSAEV